MATATRPLAAGLPTGRVFDISKGRIDDGPGLRTVIFLKGCRLDCPWCHNPEGIGSFLQLSFSAERCISCGLCAQACPRDWSHLIKGAWRDGCELTGACVEACPTGARKLVGRDITPAEAVEAVLSDRDFFMGTGGGVTFSGGEPLLQAEFVFEVARRLRDEGLHVAVETGGFWAKRHASDLADVADLVLFDLKHVELEKLTSTLVKGSPKILENLAHLLEYDVEVQVHITLVPGFNETKADLEAIGSWLRSLPRTPQVRLKPFHRLATAKHTLYASTYPYAEVEPPTRQDVLVASRYLANLGLDVDIEAV